MLTSRYWARILDGGRVPCSGSQVLLRVVDHLRELLEPARHVHRPPVVAEVTSELAQDRGHCERLKGISALAVVAVDRLEQAQRGDLQQVLERLGGAPVATRQSIALTRPRLATWTRSSSDSFVPLYRRARLRANGMKRSKS